MRCRPRLPRVEGRLGGNLHDGTFVVALLWLGASDLDLGVGRGPDHGHLPSCLRRASRRLELVLVVDNSAHLLVGLDLLQEPGRAGTHELGLEVELALLGDGTLAVLVRGGGLLALLGDFLTGALQLLLGHRAINTERGGFGTWTRGSRSQPD